MALDEPRENDHVIDIDNFQYLVDKNFMETAQPITVDFMQMGFKITSGMQLNPNEGCSGCGATSNCC